MNTIKHLYILLAVMLCTYMPVMAQNTDDRNKAIIETKDGSQELNTDDIQVIRFDGGKVTLVQPWGETTFDRTLQRLTFFRPLSGYLRLTVDANINNEVDGGASNRAFEINGSGQLASIWKSGDQVYVYADDVTTTSIGTLTPETTGTNYARLVGDIDASGLSDGQTLYMETQPRTFSFATQTGSLDDLFYVKATATVSIVGANATISDATFTRPMAIVKFTLIKKSDGTSPINATSFIINDGTHTYTVTPGSATNEFFVGIPAIDNGTVTLTATEGSDAYSYERADVTFSKGKYYTISVKMAKLFTCNSSNWSTQVAAFNAEVSDNPTLQLTSNIDLFRHNLIITRADGTFDLNGHTITAFDIRNNVEGKSITIKNGTVSGSGDVAIDGHPDWDDFYHGTVILEDLTVNKMIFVDGHQYVINSGTYNEKIFNVTSTGYPGKLIINGGSFLQTIHGEYVGVVYGTYELYGGKYAVRPQDEWCAAGYCVKANTDSDSGTYPWIVAEGTAAPAPTGSIDSKFTVSANGKQVYFSKGNIQYFCSTSAPEWKFAEHQYDYISYDNSAYSENSEKWIDLFAYGTSGYDNGQTNWQPYKIGGSGWYPGNLTGDADWGYKR